MAKLDPRSWDYQPPKWVNRLAHRGVTATVRNRGTNESLAMFQKVLTNDERRYGRANQKTINTMCIVANLMYDAGRFDRATALYEEALGYLSLRRGPENEQTLFAESQLARTFLKTGRYEEAVSLLTHVVGVATAQNAPASAETASRMISLAVSLRRLGRYEEARLNYERSIEVYRLLGMAEHRNALMSASWSAICLELLGNIEGAIEYQRRVVEQWGRVYGRDHADTLKERIRLARWLHRVNENAEAKVLILGVIEAKAGQGADDDDIRRARKLLADVERSEGTG